MHPAILVPIFTASLALLQKIMAGAGKVEKHKGECRDLAAHASSIAEDIQSFDAAGVVAMTAGASRAVSNLETALQEALKLVKSCQQGGECLLCSLQRFVGGDSRFDDMRKKLDRCHRSLILQFQLEALVRLDNNNLRETEKKRGVRRIEIVYRPIVIINNNKKGDEKLPLEGPKSKATTTTKHHGAHAVGEKNGADHDKKKRHHRHGHRNTEEKAPRDQTKVGNDKRSNDQDKKVLKDSNSHRHGHRNTKNDERSNDEDKRRPKKKEAIGNLKVCKTKEMMAREAKKDSRPKNHKKHTST